MTDHRIGGGGRVAILVASETDYRPIAGVISSSFDNSWSVGAITTLMNSPGAGALVARGDRVGGGGPVGPGMEAARRSIARVDEGEDEGVDEGSTPGAGPVLGACLFRVAADEAEVLAFAVAPAFRRAGIGSRLLDACVAVCREAGAGAVFLEVAVDNDPATRLYRRRGFLEVGRRPNYYRSGTHAVDALILRSSTRTTIALPDFDDQFSREQLLFIQHIHG